MLGRSNIRVPELFKDLLRPARLYLDAVLLEYQHGIHFARVLSTRVRIRQHLHLIHAPSVLPLNRHDHELEDQRENNCAFHTTASRLMFPRVCSPSSVTASKLSLHWDLTSGRLRLS